MEKHHRKNRSQGGQWNAANIVDLCPPCHRDVTVQITLAREQGYNVRSFEDEYEVPVFWFGKKVYLNDDGTVSDIE